MRSFVLFLGLVVSFQLTAGFSPVEGMWYDPDASGRGITVEMQNNVLVVTYFGYGSDRSDRWWQGVGVENTAGSSVYSGTFNSFSGGQCGGCGYQQPVSSADGEFTITFSTWDTATLQWNGNTEHLQKGIYGYPSQKDYMRGMWMFSSFSSSAFSLSKAVILFNSTYTSSSGVEYIKGNLSGYSGDSRVALAGTTVVNGEERLLITLDYSTRYYLAMLFFQNENRGVGESWLYPKTGSISGSGLLAVSAKAFDLHELSGSTSKTSGVEPVEFNLNDNEVYNSFYKNSGAADEAISYQVAKMTSALEEISAK